MMGICFGNVDVYCPWDVINYCSDHIANQECAPKNYWVNTSGNDVIHRFINSIYEPAETHKTGVGTSCEWWKCPERNQSGDDL